MDHANLPLQDRSIGKGAQVKKGDQISCRYIGKLENRKEFDGEYDEERFPSS